MQARDCIPKDKHDLLALKGAKELGFPTLNAILPDLLRWLQDGNWPVAQPTALVLANAGREIIPPIKDILAGDDGCWKCFLMELLIGNLSPDLRLELRDDLKRLANQPTESDKHDGVDIRAQELLASKLPEK